MTHHLRCTPCRLRFDRRRIPDIDACPSCGGALEPLPLADALGLSLFRGLPLNADTDAAAPTDGHAPMDAPAWTSALAMAIEQLPPTAR